MPDPSRPRERHTQDFIITSTFHGLRHYYGSKNIIGKVFWITVLTTGFTLVSYQIYRLIQQFCDNPTVTDIRVVYPADGLTLPLVTVCLLTKINQTALSHRYPEVNLTVAEFMIGSFLSAYNTALMDPDYFLSRGYNEEALDAQLTTFLRGRTIVDLFEDISFQCEQLFLKGSFINYCWYQNGPVKNCCDDQNFSFKRFLTHNGPCFSLDGDRLPQNLPGPVGGFGFIYRHPLKHIMPTVFGSYDVNAIYLFTEPAAAIIEKNPILLPIGSRAHWNQSLTFFHGYSFEKCQVECMIDNLMKECNCAGLNTYVNFPRNMTCSPLEANRCYKRLAYNFSRILSSCRKVECLEACEYWSYSHSLTLGEAFYPGVKKMQAQYWRLPEDCDEKSIVMADIYFDDILYTEVLQLSAFTLEALVSNIGGALGLWTGARDFP